MNLASLLRRFLVAKIAVGLSPRTLDWYRLEVAAYLRNSPEPLSPESVDAYLAMRRARGEQPATIAGHYRALSAFFTWLVDRRYLKRKNHPLRGVEKPRVPKKQPRTAEIADFTALLKSLPRLTWIDARDRLAIVTLFMTAVRVGELVALTIEDYDLVAGLLAVRRGKGGDARFVPLLPVVKTEFAAYMMARPAYAGSAVFLSADGGSLGVAGALTISGFRQMLKRRCAKAGIPYLNPHSFRHGLAIYLLNDKGADMALIQRILGHATIQVTAQIYARWRDDGVSSRYAAIMRDTGA